MISGAFIGGSACAFMVVCPMKIYFNILNLSREVPYPYILAIFFHRLDGTYQRYFIIVRVLLFLTLIFHLLIDLSQKIQDYKNHFSENPMKSGFLNIEEIGSRFVWKAYILNTLPNTPLYCIAYAV